MRQYFSLILSIGWRLISLIKSSCDGEAEKNEGRKLQIALAKKKEIEQYIRENYSEFISIIAENNSNHGVKKGELVMNEDKDEGVVIGSSVESRVESSIGPSIDIVNYESSSWAPYRDLDVHKGLFRRGIVAPRPHSSIGEGMDEYGVDLPQGEIKISIGSRTFHGRSEKVPAKIQALLQPINSYARHAENIPIADNSFMMFNVNRREEVFVPLVVNDKESEDNIGFYVYPWLSNNFGRFNFSGFNRFVTAGCMFGSVLKGVDQHGNLLDLIKHDIRFHPSQKIEKVVFNSRSSNAYETVVCTELQKLLVLLDRLSKRPDSREITYLHYHLPYYDYMLFGIELFIRGRMTSRALSDLLRHIFAKKDDYVTRINKICSNYDVALIFESPFKNLFGDLNDMEQILRVLNLSVEEPDRELDEQEKIIKEKELVHYCLDKLTTNEIDENHRQIWIDLVNVLGKDKINNLEDLFKAANSMVIAHASLGSEDYETCSLLPVSEKQIQVSYADFCKKMQGHYKPIYNMTMLDPVISHDHNSRGLLFYFGSCQESLRELVEDRNILGYAHKNIARRLEGRDEIGLEQVLQGVAKLKI